MNPTPSTDMNPTSTTCIRPGDDPSDGSRRQDSDSSGTGSQATQANRTKPQKKPKKTQKKSNTTQKTTGKSNRRERYRKAKEAKGRRNHPNDNILGLGQADWTNTAFITQGPVLTEQDLLTGAQPDPSLSVVMPAPVPAPAYTPPDNAASIAPAHSTHIQSSALTNPTEVQPTDTTTNQATTAAAHESHDESTIDYEDETMEDAGDAGTH
ncbi:hypothetical protein RhiLY_03438 [Ceratobasidium sp. AG-Ba]|nr:hypothetical protein RhiLY_03438 [Ceratobasidium sp. AG-Ba]